MQHKSRFQSLAELLQETLNLDAVQAKPFPRGPYYKPLDTTNIDRIKATIKHEIAMLSEPGDDNDYWELLGLCCRYDVTDRIVMAHREVISPWDRLYSMLLAGKQQNSLLLTDEDRILTHNNLLQQAPTIQQACIEYLHRQSENRLFPLSPEVLDTFLTIQKPGYSGINYFIHRVTKNDRNLRKDCHFHVFNKAGNPDFFIQLMQLNCYLPNDITAQFRSEALTFYRKEEDNSKKEELCDIVAEMAALVTGDQFHKKAAAIENLSDRIDAHLKQANDDEGWNKVLRNASITIAAIGMLCAALSPIAIASYAFFLPIFLTMTIGGMSLLAMGMITSICCFDSTQKTPAPSQIYGQARTVLSFIESQKQPEMPRDPILEESGCPVVK